MSAIELAGVSKRYERNRWFGGGGVSALSNIDLAIDEGEIFGFLGPNGAGKSTTIDLLLGFKRPTAGTVRVLDVPVEGDHVDIRRRLGVLPEGCAPIGERTGRQHIEFAITVKQADNEPEELLDRVGMLEPADYPMDEYSKGMVQRIMLAMSLVGEPDLLILDEPTTGLDPNGARMMRQIVREENERGATVFFSSHILEQVEAVCDRVGILDNGQLIAMDSIDTLQQRISGTAEIGVELSRVPSQLVEDLRAMDGVSSVNKDDFAVSVTCEQGSKSDVIAKFYESDAVVEKISTTDASLEELFEEITSGGRH